MRLAPVGLLNNYLSQLLEAKCGCATKHLNLCLHFHQSHLITGTILSSAIIVATQNCL
jgi:hypothetical protein